MPQDPVEESFPTQRVFGFFAFAVALGIAYSLLAPAARTPASANGARAGADAETEVTLAYAACQARVRDAATKGDALRFPENVESFGHAGSDRRAIVAKVVVAPALGDPFVQRFVCRVQRVGTGPASVWRVARLNMDQPVS